MPVWMKVVSVSAVMLALARPAAADAILTIGNNPQSGDENVLLNTGVVGNPIFGLTNQTNLSVKFLSNENLVAPSNGQARVEAQDGWLTYLEVSLPGGSFESLIFNLDAAANGTVDFTAQDTEGNTFYFLNQILGGSGSNFFTFTTNGERLASVSLLTDTPVVLTDAEQFRIGGARIDTTTTPTDTLSTVPEPMSLVLLGSGLVGCAGRLRRSRKKD